MSRQQDVFSSIYKSYGFGSTESRSGPGSTVGFTETLRKDLLSLIKRKKIKSVVDFPCGDFEWMKEIVSEFEYTGCDIVPECIEENKAKYKDYNFICADLISDEIPEGDLLIVRDALIHMPLIAGKKAINNILSSKCKYVLMTTWINYQDDLWSCCKPGDVDRENENIEWGRFYPVNLLSHPFNFPPASEYLEEDIVVDGYDIGNRKAMGLWKISDLKEYFNSNTKEVVLGIYGSHNSSISLAIDNEIKEVIEIERFVNEKNASLYFYPPTLVDDAENVLLRIKNYLEEKYFIDHYDIVYHDMIDEPNVQKVFPAREYIHTQHHVNHAHSSLYQSKHKEALVLSFDGGGNDGWFVLFKHSRGNQPEVLHTENVNYGVCYSMISHYISEVKHEETYLEGNLVYAGKIMGLAGYGQANEAWQDEFDTWYGLPTGVDHEGIAKKMMGRLGVELTDGLANSDDSKNLAATNQAALERNVIKIIQPFLDEYPDLPLHITGGGGLNILLNTLLAETRETFITPNPSDCGLTVGMLAGHIKSDKPIDITYKGPEVFDKDKLQEYLTNYDTSHSLTDLVDDLADGKIVGVVREGCEHGPRALGNRSILCNPCFPEMKDTLNAKVKHREWYRPFAPVVRLEDVNEYFEWDKESRWMNYCPKVKEEYKEKLSSITHVDGTARVQTVTKDQNPWLYNLLTEFKNKTGYGVLLNTSFNVDGKPILNTYSDAFIVLNSTELDSLFLDGTYVFKNNEMKIEPENQTNNNLTIVSGLWDIARPGRDFELYKERFEEFLQINQKMILFLPKSLHRFVWERRSKKNTKIVPFELDDIKQLFAPFWENVQKIRSNENWKNQASWLPESPQSSSEWYNPIVMSKYSLLHTAVCYNNFNTDYFVWLDAGITFTCSSGFFTDQFFERLPNHIDPFLFLSYPYDAVNEIHGFDYKKMNAISKDTVKYVCRGGLFGGHKEFITKGNHTYWHLVNDTLNQGLMGTEESIFTIMAHQEPNIYKRYSLDSNGLIVKFIQDLSSNENVSLEKVTNKKQIPKPTMHDISNIKTNLYFLTFNYPEQLEYTLETLGKHNDFLDHPTQKIIIDNSTNDDARKGNAEICKKYGFEHIIREENTGINGGRQFAADHFHDSDSDYYLFFEDDMTLVTEEDTRYCRNGLRRYIPNLYKKLHQIIIKEDFDFLKLSFTEVYMDNNIQTSWYNVPQDIRNRDWPEYNQLPETGLDPHSPRTHFDRIERLEDGLCYITGDVYYSNWPMIVSKKGNQKMFINTKWACPYEQTWMSFMYMETKEGNLNPSCLLASPVEHERFKHYSPSERREN